MSGDETWYPLAAFALPSCPGSDEAVVNQVATAVKKLPFTREKREAMKTAVAEAALNGIEHGNRFQPELPLEIAIWISETAVVITITDQGNTPIPLSVGPDIYAKLEKRQSPRGWGLFLIDEMADAWQIVQNESQHTIELKFDFEQTQPK